MFVEGGPGEGKTVFMVKLIHLSSFQSQITIHQALLLSCFFFFLIILNIGV